MKASVQSENIFFPIFFMLTVTFVCNPIFLVVVRIKIKNKKTPKILKSSRQIYA